ncbi:hypothetical protein [Taibaiella soli]|uniref:DegT/DnrJ/EryC1/StrS aminotransferase family protein n=1 Tax=Taibaiella soli TaxID=1649169 RepID=A0A2W2BKN7_9BACT|nr:hypothetical protein [Taibaiella soli]PZF74036.1 hypothetical protein DN068_04910 [Taibaiella soli]
MIKEYGSDFHYLAECPEIKGKKFLEDYLGKDYQLHFSGRTALYSLIKNGIENLGWKRICFPEYFCHGVIDYIRRLDIDVLYYNDGPYVAEFDSSQFAAFDTADTAIFIVNYFGCQKTKVLNVEKAVVIEDHTHNPVSAWALRSSADFCIASLRKTMPIPAGGLLWSPKRKQLPVNVGDERSFVNSCFFMNLSAMVLKAEYLNGGNVAKQDFRDLFIESESMYSDIRIQGPLPEFGFRMINYVPVNSLIETKTRNLKLLQELIDVDFETVQGYQIDEVPLGLIILNESKEIRDRLRAYLAARNIYTAVLWPNQPTAQGRDFSDSMLLLHVDIRYDANDIAYMAKTLQHWAQSDLFKSEIQNATISL